MVSSYVFSFFLLFCSFLRLGFSHQNADDVLQSLTAMANNHHSVQCMQKLFPCQDFMKSPTHPPESCCSSLKEAFTHDIKCLCHYFDDPKTLQTVNVTKEDALKLPKACNLNPDLSLCKKDAGAAAAPAPGGSNKENLPNSKFFLEYGRIYQVETGTASIGARRQYRQRKGLNALFVTLSASVMLLIANCLLHKYIKSKT